MANVDLTTILGSNIPESGIARPFAFDFQIDYSVVNRAAADVLQVWDIPAGTFIRRIAVQVITVEGGTLTLDIGDGTTTDGFVNGVDCNTLTNNIGYTASGGTTIVLTEATPNTVTAYSGGKYYAATDTLDIINVDAADTAVVRFVVEGHFYGLGTGFNVNRAQS